VKPALLSAVAGLSLGLAMGIAAVACTPQERARAAIYAVDAVQAADDACHTWQDVRGDAGRDAAGDAR
jgi:hypothetical protein